MSGALLGLGRGYGGPDPGTNPITIQQKIVYTAFVVSGTDRATNKNPFYGGDIDDDNMRVLRGEPCVMEKSLAPLSIGAVSRETQLFVFSCLNKYGDGNKTKAQLVRNLTWGGFAGNDAKEELPVFLGGSFTITNNGPDTWYTGDLIYWDLPNDDKEALLIGKSMGHLKTRPLARSRRNVILRKYQPGKQGATRKAIRETNSTENLLVLKAHASGRTEQYSKSHVDFVDALKKIFLLGAVAGSSGVLRMGVRKDQVMSAVKDQDDLMGSLAKIMGLQFVGGVTAENKGFHDAFIAMIMPTSADERMYDPNKGRVTPTSGRGFSDGERVLKQIQGGGRTKAGLLEANVVEHALAAIAQAQHEISSRIVGKCISSSKTGGDTDIISFSM